MPTRFFPFSFAAFLSFAAFFLFGGCDAGSDDELAAGTFQAQASGDVTFSLEGVAEFEVYDEGQFEISLLDGARVIRFSVLSGAPEEAAYPIRPVASHLEREADAYINVNALEGAILDAQAGTLTLEEASAARLRGRFTFEAGGKVEGEEQEVTVEGAFFARPLRD